MKALTLWQPWASLVAIGAKQYETRHWATPYRGPLVIHASVNREAMSQGLTAAMRSAFKAAGVDPKNLPYGKALCVVDLVACLRTDNPDLLLSDQERAFGDFSKNRYAWQLANIRLFSPPIHIAGGQKLWDWEAAYKLRYGKMPPEPQP